MKCHDAYVGQMKSASGLNGRVPARGSKVQGIPKQLKKLNRKKCQGSFRKCQGAYVSQIKGASGLNGRLCLQGTSEC